MNAALCGRDRCSRDRKAEACRAGQATGTRTGDYWILPKGKNINKSNKHPAKYFDGVDGKELRRALIERDMLDYRKYKTFLSQRTESMLSHISKAVGLLADDFGST